MSNHEENHHDEEQDGNNQSGGGSSGGENGNGHVQREHRPHGNHGEGEDRGIVLASEILPEQLLVVPLMQRPVFPGMMVPLIFSGQPMLDAIKEVTETDHRLMGAVLAKEVNQDHPFDSDLYEYGTVLKIHKVAPLVEDSIQVLVQGLQRFHRLKEISRDPFVRWQVEYFQDPEDRPGDELRAYTMAIINSVKELLKLNPLFQEQLKMLMSHISFERPGVVMDMIASMTTAEPEKLQEILETLPLTERGNKLLILLKEEIEVSRLQEKIKQSIEEKVSKQQKQYFLQEQLKIIKKELGLEKDDKTQEVEKFEKRISALKLTEEAQKAIEEEMEKLKLLEPASPEYHVTRNYLDWLTELPWGIFSQDTLDIKKAREVLDRDHYGLDDLKDRILEFIATAVKRGRLSGSIICLVGPPGVGKTSVGHSVADALNRKFFRFSVGGMRDEAEIKGHRRTYIGAMPGKLIQSLKRTGTANPVIMLDEIDKIGISFQGDPASALLEVLDPEQNKDFLDHYLDVRFDLSNILFITTANQLDTIPPALLDRMEVMKLSGYILEEKVEIARRYLIPRQKKEHGLAENEVSISDDALRFIINRYAREAGVRTLENQIKKVLRRVTRKEAEGLQGPITISQESVEEYLGQPVFSDEELYNKGIPGVALGLAWTSMGGATLYIEARSILSKGGGFKQTGQLGKVMQESSEIAYSYVRSRLDELWISLGKKKSPGSALPSSSQEGSRGEAGAPPAGDPETAGSASTGSGAALHPVAMDPSAFFNDHFVHLHVPAGATPKDGPSAGVTMALALYSLAVNKPVRNGLAMTGELTLTGKVLPIGGVKEKTIAARRVGVRELIFPKENKKDYEELPDYIREGMTVFYADYFDDILRIIFGESTSEWI